MKKLKLILIGFCLVACSSFAFAMEKNQQEINNYDEVEITDEDLKELQNLMETLEIKLENGRVEKINLTSDEENNIIKFLSEDNAILNKEKAKNELLDKIKENLNCLIKKYLNFDENEEGFEKEQTYYFTLKTDKKFPVKVKLILKTKKVENGYSCNITIVNLKKDKVLRFTSKFIKK